MKSNTKNEKKVPRPLNSYILFRVQKQREIVEQCPGANHRDISKITSKWWRELAPSEKQVYIDEAEKLKQEHKLLYPGYKFAPKKRSRAVRPYKRRPSNELIARNNEKKQHLLSLYHHGRVTHNDNEELVNQIEPKAPKLSKNTRQQQVSYSEPPTSSTTSLQDAFNFSRDIYTLNHSQLACPFNDGSYYGLSPSYSSTVSQSPYDVSPFHLFEDTATYMPNYLQPTFQFSTAEPIYPTISYDNEAFATLKMHPLYTETTLQPIQLLNRPFP